MIIYDLSSHKYKMYSIYSINGIFYYRSEDNSSSSSSQDAGLLSQIKRNSNLSIYAKDILSIDMFLPLKPLSLIIIRQQRIGITVDTISNNGTIYHSNPIDFNDNYDVEFFDRMFNLYNIDIEIRVENLYVNKEKTSDLRKRASVASYIKNHISVGASKLLYKYNKIEYIETKKYTNELQWYLTERNERLYMTNGIESYAIREHSDLLVNIEDIYDVNMFTYLELASLTVIRKALIGVSMKSFTVDLIKGEDIYEYKQEHLCYQDNYNDEFFDMMGKLCNIEVKFRYRHIYINMEDKTKGNYHRVEKSIESYKKNES